MAAQRNGPILGQYLELWQGVTLPLLVNIPDLRGGLKGAASFFWLGAKPAPSKANGLQPSIAGLTGSAVFPGVFIGLDKPAAGVSQFGFTISPSPMLGLPIGVPLQHECWVTPQGGPPELAELGDGIIYATGGSQAL